MSASAVAFLLGNDGLVAFCRSLAPYLAAYVPYSIPGYCLLLVLTAFVRKGILGLSPGPEQQVKNQQPRRLVPPGLEFAHNIFLTFQSAALMALVAVWYADTAARANLNGLNFLHFGKVLFAQERLQSDHGMFEIVLCVFLLSKIYEAVDTVILILNGKPLLLLHLWHHASILLAFYHGLFTGAGFWIGFVNSFIHVIMYMYYARISWIKPFARYITSLQIFHLFGGFVLNLLTCFVWPFDQAKFTTGDDVATTNRLVPTLSNRVVSLLNGGICFSYFFLFLAFYSRKYKSGGGRSGSIWTMCCGTGTQSLVLRWQGAVFGFSGVGGAVKDYIIAQGLLMDDGGEAGGGEGGARRTGGGNVGREVLTGAPAKDVTLLASSGGDRGAGEKTKPRKRGI